MLSRTERPQSRRALDVAVIGGGAAGMAAAYHLVRGGASVALLEQGPRLGGNCFGVEVPRADGTRARVDVGVSDFNIDSFTTFAALLEELGLTWRPIGQDASFTTRAGETPLWSRGGELHFDPQVPNTLPAEIARFSRHCVEVLDDPRFAGWTVERYLKQRGFGTDFVTLYLRPRALGAFLMPDGDPGRFSICGLVRFWKMHGLVGGRGTPPRMAIEGGMHRYVDALRDRLLDAGVHVRCQTSVLGVRSRGRSIEIHTGDERLRCHHVVIATPPGALALDTPSQSRVFNALPSTRARVVVHRDATVMPVDRRRWGAYNYVVEDGDAWPRIKPTITFSPRRIQADARLPEVFVTMNPTREPRDILAEATCTHPTATTRSTALLAAAEHLQGRANVWFCGAWLRAPFLHEQAHATAREVATRILSEEQVAA